MIEVDISNIWGEVALPELLAIEQEVAAAHAALSDSTGIPLCSNQETEHILKTAEALRACSDVCVVVGGPGSLGAQAAVELLQGSDRNSGRGKGDPQVLFAGNSFSIRRWNALLGQLEGKDFSVIAVSCTSLEAAIALRELKWLLERKYGTDESRRRVCAVTVPGENALSRMAESYGWERFSTPGDGPFGILSPAGLLPMAVAGIDVAALHRGATEARERLELRSFENPAWLYAAVRTLLHRRGKAVEVLSTWEPDLSSFGKWWQQLFAAAGGPFPAHAELPGGLTLPNRQDTFETVLRFDGETQGCLISSDANDLDNLNFLADRPLGFVAENAHMAAVEAHADSGVPVITVDCGALREETLGALFYFIVLSCGLSGFAQGADPFALSGAEPYESTLDRLLGRPERPQDQP